MILQICDKCGRAYATAYCEVCRCSTCGKTLRSDLYSLCEGCDAGVIHVAASGTPGMVAQALEQQVSRRERISSDCARCNGIGVVEIITGHRVEKELCLCDGGRVSQQAKANDIPLMTVEFYEKGVVAKGLNQHETYAREQVGHEGLTMDELVEKLVNRHGVAPDDARSIIRQAAAKGVLRRTTPPPQQVPLVEG